MNAEEPASLFSNLSLSMQTIKKIVENFPKDDNLWLNHVVKCYWFLNIIIHFHELATIVK